MSLYKRVVSACLVGLTPLFLLNPTYAADLTTPEIDESPYEQISGQEIADYAMYIATVLRPNYQAGHIAYDRDTFKEDSVDCLQFVFASMMGAVGEQRWDDNDNPAVRGLATVWWYGYDHEAGNQYDAEHTMRYLQNNTKFNPRYAYNWVQWCQQYVGKEIYLDGYNEWGEHIRQYYTVGVAGKVDECNEQLERQGSIYRIGDIKIGSRICSSYLAYAQSFPGSIIWCNGHASLGVGCFESREHMKQYYGQKGMDVEVKTRAYGRDTSITVAPQEYYGNFVYPQTDDMYDPFYYIGRGWQVSASGKDVGCRMNNATTDVGTPETRKKDQVVVLIPVGSAILLSQDETLEYNQYTPRKGWNAEIIKAYQENS